ncbi:MAG TPA: hypothetical protein VFC74_05105 [Oscillospiraceae bacterium]|nr:hypothetical protein [Oscillospiraceae bacterium]
MTIKNIRQFNSILTSVGNVEQHYTDLLTFAVGNIHRHGNKDPMISFLNAPFIRTKAGKVKKAYAPLLQWINAACPALTIGERADDKVVKFNATTLPAKVDGFNVLFDKQKEVTVTPYTDWLTEQAADKEPAAPATTVTANALVKYLDSKLALSLTASDQSEIDALVKAAKDLIVAAGKATVPDVDLIRVEELANTKASGAEKTANKKAV